MDTLAEDFKSALNLEDDDLRNDSSTSISTATIPAGPEAGNDRHTDWQELQPSFDDLFWKKFISFMHAQAQAVPYPKYLYRAHTHGHPFPRFLDIDTGEPCDNFGSDLRSFAEYDAQMEIHIQFDEPEANSPTEDVFHELSRHLTKTQIIESGEEYLSRMVSLSGNLCWTSHRVCEVGELTNTNQNSGLAVFDACRVQESGIHIWRVRDMLEFFDVSKFESRIDIPHYVQRWANNADEYVCWDLVPREALLSFTPLLNLMQAFSSVEKRLLGVDFTKSANLAAFRRHRRKRIPLESYVKRVSNFIRTITFENFRTEAGTRLIGELVYCFLDPYVWGYDVIGFFSEDTEHLKVALIADLPLRSNILPT